jgi:hypothetical protein
MRKRKRIYLLKTNNMNKEFIVTFVTSEQITECNWNVRTPAMKIKPETTVAEIEAFYRKWRKEGQMEVKIIGLEQS